MNISPFAFPLFGCFIIFILWFNYERRKHEKIEEKRDEDFWKREHDANFTRRKNLDAIEYIKIPYDSFPMENMPIRKLFPNLKSYFLNLRINVF